MHTYIHTYKYIKARSLVRADAVSRAARREADSESVGHRNGGWYGWKPSSSSNFSIRALRACPLIEIRQTVPCGAVPGNSISVNSTLPPS